MSESDASLIGVGPAPGLSSTTSMDAMHTFLLKRIARNDDGTFGVFLCERRPFCVTLERTWVNNAPDVSCIPAGTYLCRRVQSPKFGDTFEVTGVPGRSEILFHWGNLMTDSKGCILLGEQYDPIKGHDGVLSSKAAFAEFKKLLERQQVFRLAIKESLD